MSSGLEDRLGYLLKHAQLRLAELTGAALAPYGIDGRELAVLIVLAGHQPVSQQQAAGALGIDRTTMVAFVDTLEAKGLVNRRADERDRRRNLVALTEHGAETLDRAVRASDEAQQRFLAPLGPAAARELIVALQTLVLGAGA